MSSVLINFNKNLQNGEAYKFSQFYDDVINIPENATVSLNNVQLTRKAINVTENAKITFNADHTGSVATATTNKIFDSKNNAVNIEATIDKGSYSKREFLQEIFNKTNDAIDNYNLDTTKNASGYKPVVINENNKALFGLNPAIPQAQIDVKDGDRRHNNMTTSSNVSIHPTNYGTVSTSEYNTFATAQSAFMPLNYDKDNYLLSTMTFGLTDVNKSSNNIEYNIAFIPPDNAAQWASGTQVDKVTLENNQEVMQGWIGVHFNCDNSTSKTTVSIYQAANLGSVRASDFNADPKGSMGDTILVSSYETGTINNNQRYALQIYRENEVNKAYQSATKHYYRILSFNTDTVANDISEFEERVIFDSKVYNKNISNSPLVSGAFYWSDTAFPGKFYPSGLVPVFALKGDLSGSSNEDIGFYDVQAPWTNIAFDDTNSDNMRFYYGIAFNSITVEDPLINIFGDEVIYRVDPNGGLPLHQSPDFGVSQFFQDDTVYNIEVNNLPIKTYQSTTSSNVNVNIGSKRPIVFKANSLFEGKVDNLNSSRVVRTHYENFNKLLKLKNKYKTERNQLDISVRRAKTNELATEITDCSLELTIDTE